MVDNSTTQEASAAVGSGQINVSAPVTVGGMGHDHEWRMSAPTAGGGGGGGGDVTQSNEATNSATAENINDTTQEVLQGQGSSSTALGGASHGAGQDQTADVSNATEQAATATVGNGQANVSTPVAVGGGGGGDVTQSNEADNSAIAGNVNETAQEVQQGHGSSSVALPGASAAADAGEGTGQTQSADVANSTDQAAYATVDNGQYNVYAPVSVFSPGAGSGAVTQSNEATNTAAAGNANATFQGVAQGQASGWYGSGQRQHASLYNTTHQSAYSNVGNIQANIHAPVTVGSAGAGSGAVHQSNAASNSATAFNLNLTFQTLFQAEGRQHLRF